MRSYRSESIRRIGLFVCWMLGAFAVEAQTRNRSLVAWGENLLGLNRPPELPAGIVASDVEALVRNRFWSRWSFRRTQPRGGVISIRTATTPIEVARSVCGQFSKMERLRCSFANVQALELGAELAERGRANRFTNVTCWRGTPQGRFVAS